MIYLRQTPIPDPQGQTETVHGYLNKKKTPTKPHTHNRKSHFEKLQVGRELPYLNN